MKDPLSARREPAQRAIELRRGMRQPARPLACFLIRLARLAREEETKVELLLRKADFRVDATERGIDLSARARAPSVKRSFASSTARSAA